MVGLDIGTSGIKAVALRRSRAGWLLTGAGQVAMPRVGGTEATGPAEVSAAVRQVLDGLGMRRLRVAAALSGHAVIVKRLSLPAMTRGELAEAIPWEAEQYIPFDLADVQLDYQVVNTDSETARSTLDILLVAAKRERIDERAAVVAQSGRPAVVLDLEAFALANAYQMNYPERVDPLAALIHVGHSVTIACLLEHGQLVYTRDISLGARLYIEALQRELGVDETTAQRMQRGHVPSDVNQEQAASVLRDTTSQLIVEIRKTVDFHRATAPIEKLSRMVLSGGACEAEGLADLLTVEFGVSIEIFDPFRRVTRPKGSAAADAAGPPYAVAVGLAMRREGDR